MKILALDLGTKTGFAFEAKNYPLACGTLDLGGPKSKKGYPDLRFFKLVDWLDGLCLSCKPDLIVYEDVQFVKSRLQAHLWATWRAAVWLMSSKHGVRVTCCPTGTLKKFATGNGHADKADMARSLCGRPAARFKLTKDVVTDSITGATLDDNAVDALHLLGWAKTS